MKDLRGIAVAKVLGVCLVATILSGCDEADVEQAEVLRPVKAIQVTDAASFQQRWFSGRAKGTQEIDLSFRVAGTLIARPVDVGTEVSKGDIVAQVDPDTFRADVERAKADLVRAEATLTNAEEQLRRTQILVQRGHVSEAALDRHLAAEREAKADVAARQATLRRRQLDLGYATLEAPFSGVVVRTFVENFQDIQAQQPIIRLVDDSRIEMVVDVPEGLISQAHAVREILVRFDALPGVDVAATIKEIGTEASQATRTYPVTLIMDQPADSRILPGMAGKAAAKTMDSEAVPNSRIIVPETSVYTKADVSKTYVWVVDSDSGTVSAREVETAAVADEGLEVISGLKPGEYIVTAGVNYLKEGQKVRLQK